MVAGFLLVGPGVAARECCAERGVALAVSVMGVMASVIVVPRGPEVGKSSRFRPFVPSIALHVEVSSFVTVVYWRGSPNASKRWSVRTRNSLQAQGGAEAVLGNLLVNAI